MKNHRRSTSGGSFKFNVAAPEFVPTLAAQPLAPASAQVPITGFFYPCFQSIDGTSGSWIYVADKDITIPLVQSKPNEKLGSAQNQQQHQPQQQQAKEIVISDEIKNKIIKQAEYMFSDMSMLANETLVKHVNKDPEGYVPINFVSTLKKLKSLNVNNQMVAQALRASSKLVVSSDGKKVKRKLPFTEKEKEELQLRTVIAENLPDDHSHQKIEKMFNVVGSIKSIRICQPQEHNSSRSNKGDIVVSHKLHALVEYENSETAERAAEKLNDEGNWRKGMRVRLMLKRSPKSVLKSRKSDFDACIDDDGSNHHASEDASRHNTSEAESDDNSGKKSWSRNRGKPKHRPQLQSARSLPTPSFHSTGSCPGQLMKGPRMPDGTRGFTMGRGKPLVVSS
ncbi:la-related protein 6c [Phtheirospermum japonicum]|uniref:La-related protein 6c n=1 Tax=Phtheirospermum japonicum TaxID=374723 RepID=A0A830BTN6_9LAMI|nr:la-related protein 6c [Phtheirospermum japonicum]